MKVIITGDSMVGKSDLVKRFMNRELTEYKRTLGVEVDCIKNLNIWCCDGMFMRQNMYYNATSLFIIIFDTKKDIDRIYFWYTYIRNTKPNTKILLVGNNVDEHKEDSELILNNERIEVIYVNTNTNLNITPLLDLMIA